MAVSILETLQNAQMNLQNVRVIGVGIIPLLPVIQNQLNNAIGLLEKGYSLDEEVEPLLEEYGDVESVPEKP